MCPCGSGLLAGIASGPSFQMANVAQSDLAASSTSDMIVSGDNVVTCGSALSLPAGEGNRAAFVTVGTHLGPAVKRGLCSLQANVVARLFGSRLDMSLTVLLYAFELQERIAS